MFKNTPKTIRAILPLSLLVAVSITSSWASVASAMAVADSSSRAIADPSLRSMDAEQVSALPANLERELYPRSPSSDSDNATSPETDIFTTPQQPHPFISAKAARNEKTRECRVSGLCS